MKIVIFSTGIAGRAIYRKLKDIDTIVCFIDNNLNLDGKKYNNVDIIHINKVFTIEFDKIAIGGVWADSMRKQLLELGVLEEKILFIDDTRLDFSTHNRIEDTDRIVQEFAKLMRDNHISYCIEGSSLLCLLREQNLSDVPDVDILIKSQNDLKKIWQLLNESEILNKNKLTKIIYKEDKILTKKGQIDKIVLQSNIDSAIAEPTVLDINLAIDIGKYYIMDYTSELYLYFNKEFVDGKNYFHYKNMELLIPYQEKKYVELLYGKDWIKPVKEWSYDDYGNLLTTEELINFIKEHKV